MKKIDFKLKLMKYISVLSLIIAAGAVSGISRMSIYQGDEPEELNKLRKF